MYDIRPPFRLKEYVRWNSWKSERLEYFPLLLIKTSTSTLVTYKGRICEWDCDSNSKIARRWSSHINRPSMTEPQSSALSPPLDDVLNMYFHRLESAMSCTGDMIAVGNNLVHNLKQNYTSDETIFHELSVLFPQHGCPLTLYTTQDRDYMTARWSQNALLKEANDVSWRENSEFANKRQCIETERAARLLQTLSSSLTSPPATNYSFIRSQTQQSAVIKPGQYVSVEQDLSAGSCSHGGEAWVEAVHGTNGSILCNVEDVESTAGN